MGEPRSFSYRTTVFFTGLVLRLLGTRVEGTENIPARGRCLIVCNHTSNFDPPILSWAGQGRTIHYMAKKELFEHPWSRRLMRSLHAFPVDRSKADRAAIRVALERLEEERAVGIFPEGRRSGGEALGPFQEGFAILARRSGAPVIPACITRRNGRLTIRFAPGRSPQGKAKTLVAQVRADVEALL